MKEKIPSNTLIERLVDLAKEMPKEGSFCAKMFYLLSDFSKLRLIYIQNYSDYSVDERGAVSGLIEQVDRFYGDRLHIARYGEYHRLLRTKSSPESGN